MQFVAPAQYPAQKYDPFAKQSDQVLLLWVHQGKDSLENVGDARHPVCNSLPREIDREREGERERERERKR